MASSRWATVTGISPLRIKLDGDTTAIPATPDSLIDPATLVVDDRVRTELSGNRLVVLGRAGGVTTATDAEAILGDEDAKAVTPAGGKAALDARFADTGWVYPTLALGANVSGNNFGYRRLTTNGVKVVYLRGRVENLNSGNTMFTMPSGYRIDSGADNVRRLDGGGSSRVNFTDAGLITILTTSSGLSFGGLSYIAA